jgi:hypothetical protein
MPRSRTRHRHIVHKNGLVDPIEPDAVKLSDIFTGICDRQGGAFELIRSRARLDADADLTDDDTLRALADDVRTRTSASPLLDPTKPREHCVYFIRCGPHVKIGTTMNGARARFIGMQLPPGAELVGVIPGFDAVQEAALHNMFADSHVKGEWFASTPELEAVIAAHPYRS